MRQHITILAWLHIVLNGVQLLGGLLLWLFFAGLGGLAAATGGQEALPALPILGGIGALLLTIFAVLAVPGMIIGWGLLQLAPWARIAGIVISILDLFYPPIGTALGIYGLIILFNPETVALFERREYRTY